VELYQYWRPVHFSRHEQYFAHMSLLRLRDFRRQPGSYGICKVCFWEDDPVQLLDPWFRGGANTVSLAEAQLNFQKHGASEIRFKKHVRPALPSDVRDSR
jgi:hypothetical protein